VVITSLDNYIVNTSMPVILRELHDPAFYAWVTSAFILAQVIGLSLGGAWRDRIGLRLPFVTSVIVFGLGSLASGFAPNMALLVAARGVQGFGGGGLSAVSFAAAAGYPEALRIRMFSLNSTVWGVVSLVGPLAGGLITDHIGWRWIFLLNVPVCVVVMLIGLRGYPSTPSESGSRKLPVVRAALLAVAAASLVAAPSAALKYAIPLLIVGLLTAWLYARQERLADVHVIPLSTWLRRDAVGSCMQATLFFTGAYMGASVFLPLYLQGVRGLTATQASVAVTVTGVSWTLAALAAAQATGPWPKRTVRGGALLVVLGGVCVAFQAVAGHSPIPLIIFTWALAACGIGMAMIHLMNWAIVFAPGNQTGAISGAVQTCRMLGSASGGALMGALLLAIGPDAQHLPRAIASIFLLVAILALWPATFGMPRDVDRAAAAASPVPVEAGV
ncbi:MAG: MFS transporter, partial [Chloroflexota bacterium]|nr:MFS transporter [Chloroflexota bacterium]